MGYRRPGANSLRLSQASRLFSEVPGRHQLAKLVFSSAGLATGANADCERARFLIVSREGQQPIQRLQGLNLLALGASDYREVHSCRELNWIVLEHRLP